MAKDKSAKKSKLPQPSLDLPVSSPTSSKKRSLADAQLDQEDIGEPAIAEKQEEVDEDAAAKALSKLEKGKSKKRRKEEERALVRPPYRRFAPVRDVQLILTTLQANPPSFSFDTRGFKGGRMIQVRVGDRFLCSRCALILTLLLYRTSETSCSTCSPTTRLNSGFTLR